MASLPPALRVRRIRFAAAPRAGWSDIGMYRGVAIAAPVGGHTACMPLHIPDTANRSCPGAQGECGSRRLPVSIPPCPRTRGPRFRECVDKVHDLASSKLSHAALGARRRPTTNPEFPHGMVTDPSGAAIPGAAVIVSSGEFVQSVSTDDAGQYRIGGLEPGYYRVHVRSAGFTAFNRTGLV